MVKRAVPSPEQVRAYLVRHGWMPEESPPGDVTEFTFSEPSDDGNPITVFVPSSPDIPLYPLGIHHVVVTAAWVDDRDEDAVWADMLATDPTPAAPAADKPATAANGSAAPKGVPTSHPE